MGELPDERMREADTVRTFFCAVHGPLPLNNWCPDCGEYQGEKIEVPRKVLTAFVSRPEGMREAVEAVAQALCAWPMVAVDDREHNTATHMATDAVKAMLPFLGGLPPNPNEDEIDAGIAALKRLEPDETSYRGIVEAVLRAVDARPSGAPGEQR